MIPKEILKKVRQIEIATGKLVTETFAGQYESVFKGRGMEFAEVREYFPGDDIRSIDWNVTARMNRPYVKLFTEERELTSIILADVSSSCVFGTAQRTKSEMLAELAAVLAFSAVTNNDKIGLILFSDTVENFIPPKKGRRHVLRVIRDLLYFQPRSRQTNIRVALDYLGRVIRKRAVVFLISDFFSPDFSRSFKIIGKKHDIVPIIITDPREMSLPNVGLIKLKDAETGELELIDTSDRTLRQEFSERRSQERMGLKDFFRANDIDFIEFFTDQSYIKPLIAFFKRRAKKFR
ncbi:MAG: DUF58 domain-containing protein [Candidatus Omnitrophica bacterium]|nr:DUF58 domain-containing protein [Candidatus Omnitrophota bacterium]